MAILNSEVSTGSHTKLLFSFFLLLLSRVTFLYQLSFFFLRLFFFFNLAVLGLHFCARAFSSCGERGSLFIAVRGPLTIAASLVAEHRLQTRRLSSCGSRALERRLSSCGARA